MAVAASTLCALLLAMPAWGQAPSAPSLSISASKTAVNERDDEAARTITFTVTTTAAATTNAITVDYALSGTDITTDDYTAPSTTNLSIGTDATTVEFNITIADDNIDEETTEMLTVRLTNAGGGDTGATPTISATAGEVVITITDDDTDPGVTIVPDPLSISEGDMGTYTVVLDTQPSAEVTITLGGTLPTGVTMDPDVAATLTFTTTAADPAGDGWDEPQMVTITTTANSITGGNQTFNVTHTVSGDDTVYSALPPESLAVTIVDEVAVPGVTIDPDPLSISEGDMGTYTVVLDTEPSAEVTITLGLMTGSTLPTGVTMSPALAATLTFTTTQGGANGWDVAQTVTITTTEDDIDGEDQMFTVTHAVSGGDTVYNALPPESLAVTIADDDTAGLIVPEGPLTMGEGGAPASYTIALATQPTADVTVSIPAVTTLPADVTATIGTDSLATETELIFTTIKDDPDGNGWNEPVTVAITAADETDATDTDDEDFTITHQVTSTDTKYNEDASVADFALIVNIFDNDVGVAISHNTLEIDEGESGTYTVVLLSQPTMEVTLTATVTGETTPHAELTFAATPGGANGWNVAQTVTITSDQDDDPFDTFLTITHLAASGDGDYDTMEPARYTYRDGSGARTAATALTAHIIDDKGGVVVSHNTFSLHEANSPEMPGTAEYTVVLSSQPSDEVEVGIMATTDGKATISADTLTFAAARGGTNGWNVAQTVTIAVTPDNRDANDEDFTITHQSKSFDNKYHHRLGTATYLYQDGSGMTVEGESEVTVTIADDDTPTITIPNPAAVLEADAMLEFVVSTSAAHKADMTVQYYTSDGAGDNAALAANDYTEVPMGTPSTATITAGELTSVIAIAITNDAIHEAATETFTVTLTMLDGGPEGREAVFEGTAEDGSALTMLTAVGTINNDDVAPTKIELSAPVEEIGEQDGATTVVVTATLQGDTTFDKDTAVVVTVAGTSTAAETVEFTTTGLTDEGQLTITIGAGTASATGTFTLLPTTDFTVDEDEVVEITGDAEGLTVASHRIVLVDNDSVPMQFSFSIDPDEEREADAAVMVTATAQFGAGDTHREPVTVTVTVAPDPETAVADDFDVGTDPITFMIAAGMNTGTGTFPVTITNDAIDKGNRTLIITGSAEIGTATLTDTATFTITDDDQPAVIISHAALNLDENPSATVDPGAESPTIGNADTYTVVLGSQPTGDVTVAVAGLAPPAAPDAAAPPAPKLSATPPTLTFAATADGTNGWNVARTVTLAAQNDTDANQDELTVTHTATSTDPNYNDTEMEPATYVYQNGLGTVQAGAEGITVTIIDDDTPRLSIEAAAADEGDEAIIEFTVSTSAVYDGEITVEYYTTDGTGATAATAGADFTGVADTAKSTLTIPANEAAAIITIDLINDNTHEADGATFTVTIDTLVGGPSGREAEFAALPNANPGDPAPTMLPAVGTINDDDEQSTEITLKAFDATGMMDLTEVAEDTNAAVEVVIEAEFNEAAFAMATEVEVTVVGTAVDGADDADDAVEYEVAEGADTLTITIPADATSAQGTFTFTMPADDTTTEDDETLTISGTAAGNATITAVNSDTITLVDNDGVPDHITLTVSPESLSEDKAAEHPADRLITVTATFPVGSNAANTQSIEVVVTMAPDGTTATADDFAVEPAMLTITVPGGMDSASAQFTIADFDDDFDEVDEQLLIIDGSATFVEGEGATATTITIENDDVTSATFTIEDDDEIGITITHATLDVEENTLKVEENTSNEFTVVLNSQPTEDVTIALTSAPAADAVTITPRELTFTAGDESNWDTAQTVTIAAAIDDNTDVETLTIDFTVTSADTDYNALEPVFQDATGTAVEDATNIAVTVTDDVGLLASLTLPDGPIAVSEGDDTETYTVGLSAAPGTDITVTITSSDDTKASTMQTPLTFTNDNWETAQTVTITAPDEADETDEDDETITFSHQITGDNYEGVAADDLTINIADDEALRIVLNPAAITLDDESDSKTYAVVLNIEPSAETTVTITADDENQDAVTIVPATPLTFAATPDGDNGWNVAQTVTISALADNDSNNETVVFTHTPTGSDYGDEQVVDLTVEVRDDDAASVLLTDADGTAMPATINLSEGGSMPYAIAVGTQPGADDTITVTITTDDANQDAATITPTTFTFTADDWNTPQPVTISALVDADDADETLTITHTPAGGDYGDDQAVELTVEIEDDDEAGISLTDADGAALDPAAIALIEEHEENAEQTYSVALDTQPSAETTLTITTDDANQDAATITPTTLVFTTDNWDTPQPVTVSALVDADQADEMLTLTHTPTGSNYADQEAPEVTVRITDNDAPRLVVTDADGAVLDPAAVDLAEGESVMYSVALGTQPSAAVALAIAATEADQDAATITPAALTFTADNWQTPQPVTLSALVDDDADHEEITITHTPTGAAEYAALDAVALTLEISDDDIEHIAFADTENEALDPADTVAVSEGDHAVYHVTMTTQPTAEAVVMIAATDEDQEELSIHPYALTFTNENWETAQPVTLSAPVDDDISDETLTLSHTPTGDDFKDDVTPSLLTVQIDDDGTLKLKSVRLAEGSAPMSPDDETYGMGETITLQAEFTRPVTVSGTPQLRLVVGEKTRLADYVAPAEDEAEDEAEALADAAPIAQEEHAASAIVAFAYKIQPDDEAPDGIAIPANPLELGEGDSIVDSEDGDVSVETDIAEGDFAVNIPTYATKVNGKKDFLLTAKAGDDQEVNEGDPVTLSGSAETGDPDSAKITYAWGLKDPSAAPWFAPTPVEDDPTTVIFAIPNITSSVDLTFVFTVTNTRTKNVANVVTDEVVVKITAQNHAPAANAGPDQQVEEGDTVSLVGSGVDPEGAPLTYAWRLSDGNGAYITPWVSATSASTAFTLGLNIPHKTTLTFELKVTDPGGESGVDLVTITVNSAPLGEVLGHALSRFGRTLGTSAVDTLTERFGAPVGHSPSGLVMNLGGTQMSFAKTAPGTIGSHAAGTADTMHGAAMYPTTHPAMHGAMTTHAPGALPGMTAGMAASNANITGPFMVNHFDERLFMRGNNLPTLDRNQIMRSNFQINMGGADALGASGGGGNNIGWSVWGRFDNRNFEGAPREALTLDASVTMGYVGADARFGANQQFVAGLAISSAESDVEFTQDDLEGDIALAMTTFFPYGSADLSDTLSTWGMLGIGSGDAEVKTDAGHLLEADTSMLLLAVGVRSEIQPLGAIDLAFKGDAFIVNTGADDVVSRNIVDVNTSVQRVRGGLEASRLLQIGDGSFIRSSFELAGRVDAGDAEAGFGVEVNAGAAIENTAGFALETRVRHLIAHSNGDIVDGGYSVVARFDPGGAGGLRLTFAPAWGDMNSTANAMWQSDQPLFHGNLPGAPSQQDARAFNMNTELQYAFLTRDWSVAPYALLTTSSTFERERFGLRIAPLKMTNGNLSLDLFGEQTGSSDTAIMQPGVQATLQLLVR